MPLGGPNRLGPQIFFRQDGTSSSGGIGGQEGSKKTEIPGTRGFVVRHEKGVDRRFLSFDLPKRSLNSVADLSQKLTQEGRTHRLIVVEPRETESSRYSPSSYYQVYESYVDIFDVDLQTGTARRQRISDVHDSWDYHGSGDSRHELDGGVEVFKDVVLQDGPNGTTVTMQGEYPDYDELGDGAMKPYARTLTLSKADRVLLVLDEEPAGSDTQQTSDPLSRSTTSMQDADEVVERWDRETEDRQSRRRRGFGIL